MLGQLLQDLKLLYFLSFLIFCVCYALWPEYMFIYHCKLLWQCPTTIVPFFGDQPFWGDRVHARGVGPPPIPVDQFSLEKLVNAIKFMLKPEVSAFVILCRVL